MTNFDCVIDRNHTASTKWGRYEKDSALQGTIPLWVADMDFACLPEIRQAIEKRAQHEIYGYTDMKEEAYDALIKWQKQQYDVEIQKEHIVWSTGVVYSIYAWIQNFVQADEKVIVQTPVYPPFFNTPKALHRKVVFSPLRNIDGKWEIDFEDFEKKLKEDASIKMFILCNPHNPVGRCYRREELNRLAMLCHKYDVLLVADEIHSDLIMPNQHHTSIFKVEEQYHDRIIYLGSCTKTFNIAGLKISFAIIKNKTLHHRFQTIAKASGLSSINLFASEAMIAAYTYGAQWVKECCEYIYHNHVFVKSYLQQEIPEIEYEIPEATYLGWIHLPFCKAEDNICEKLKYEAHVELQDGALFEQSNGVYLRINVACPRKTLEEGCKRLCEYLKREKRK